MHAKASCILLAATLLLAACQSAPAPKSTAAVQSPSQSQPIAPPTPAADEEKFHTDPALVADPCADRMQDLCEAMLLYYLSNHHLPATLPELQPYADPGVTLSFKCPTTGDPFIYNPNGYAAPGVHDILLLYDAAPVHNGHRWGIVLAPPEARKQAVMYVVPLQQNLLDAYLHAKQQ